MFMRYYTKRYYTDSTYRGYMVVYSDGVVKARVVAEFPAGPQVTDPCWRKAEQFCAALNAEYVTEDLKPGPRWLSSLGLACVADPIKVNGTCPTAGYDQIGEYGYCLDCSKHWYGDCPCTDEDCPLRPKEMN